MEVGLTHHRQNSSAIHATRGDGSLVRGHGGRAAPSRLTGAHAFSAERTAHGEPGVSAIGYLSSEEVDDVE